MEATYVGIHMWKQAVEKAKSPRRRQGAQGHVRPDLQGALRLHAEDGRDQPSPVEAGDDRRDPGRRPVQRGVEDQDHDPRPALEPLRSGQREEAERLSRARGTRLEAREAALRMEGCKLPAPDGWVGPQSIQAGLDPGWEVRMHAAQGCCQGSTVPTALVARAEVARPSRAG